MRGGRRFSNGRVAVVDSPKFRSCRATPLPVPLLVPNPSVRASVRAPLHARLRSSTRSEKSGQDPRDDLLGVPPPFFLSLSPDGPIAQGPTLAALAVGDELTVRTMIRLMVSSPVTRRLHAG